MESIQTNNPEKDKKGSQQKKGSYMVRPALQEKVTRMAKDVAPIYPALV